MTETHGDGGDDSDGGVAHLYCHGCERNPTLALIDGEEVVVCHCTHVDGELAPVAIHGFDIFPDRWEFTTETTT